MPEKQKNLETITAGEEGQLMNLFQISATPLWLVLFLVIAVAGCSEQKQKSKETGEAIIGIVKDAEKNVNDAVLKMQEKTNQLEEADN